MTKQIRIAAVKETGRVYKVNCLNFDRGVVQVFGPVTEYRNNVTKHLKGYVFQLAEVEISKIEATPEFSKKAV